MVTKTLKEPAIIFGVLSVVLFIPVAANELVFQLNDFYYGMDYWEHTGVFAEWLNNLFHPGMPHVLSEAPGQSARYMPFFFVLAGLGGLFGLEPMQIMVLSSFASYWLIVFGIKVFFPTYFEQKWAAVVGIVLIFCGFGFGWLWSNLYQLRSFIYVSGYPSSFTFGLTLVSLWLAVKYLRELSTGDGALIGIAILVFLMFTCHPLTGAFGIGAVGLMALTEPSSHVSLRLKLIATVLLATLATELWPYYSPISIALGIAGDPSTNWLMAEDTPKHVASTVSRFEELTTQHPFYNIGEFLITLGPALIGIPVCVWFLYKRQHLFIALGFFAMLVPYFGNLFVKIPLGHRFLLFGIVFLHLALTWWVLTLCRPRTDASAEPAKGKTLALISVAGAFLLAFNLGLTALEIYGIHISTGLHKKYRQNDTPRVTEQLAPLGDAIQEDAVILAPQQLSWPMSTFVAKTVPLHHKNPYVADYAIRNSATRAFFKPDISTEKRLEILQSFSATHVVALQASAENTHIMPFMEKMGVSSKIAGDWIIYPVNNLPKSEF